MNEEDFYQMMRDLFSLAEQRHKERHEAIMAQATDILAKVTAINSSLDILKSKYETALAGMAETVPAGHAAVLDTFVGPLDEAAKKVESLAEMEAKIKALPVPGSQPPAAA